MSISQRKSDHLEICATEDVGFRQKTTLLEQVELMHDSLPELALADVDTGVELLGKRLRAPIIIGAMTGGTAEATAINRDLATVAEQCGYGFALGSQRPMLSHPDDPSYRVRAHAPSCLLLGNLGAVQARALPTSRVGELCRAVDADAMCIHLNPAQELVQPSGDRDFTGVVDALARLAEGLPVPIVVKETGCGMSPATLLRLAQAGVRHVEVSGAGGTSWVAVESARSAQTAPDLGTLLRDWGVPTAASVAYARRTVPAFDAIVASGGVASGLDVARAIALGASAAALARPVLRAHHHGGADAVARLLSGVEQALRAVMVLVGTRSIAELRAVPYVVGAELQRWLTSSPR